MHKEMPGFRKLRLLLSAYSPRIIITIIIIVIVIDIYLYTHIYTPKSLANYYGPVILLLISIIYTP